MSAAVEAFLDAIDWPGRTGRAERPRPIQAGEQQGDSSLGMPYAGNAAVAQPWLGKGPSPAIAMIFDARPRA
jgi:hypothetical protein